MKPILAGIETEYGLLVEGRQVGDQIEDAMALVREISDECFIGWNYRHESPRADLRGFQVSGLAVDPIDARFDEGKSRGPDHEVRSDRVLRNGARFYNDHGHPEYSTPECWGLNELVLHDVGGQRLIAEAGRKMEARLGVSVKLYKNNTDFHGASYGTHENYLVPRSLGFERLRNALVPILVTRQILCGAGKVGFEHGAPAEFQMSQRADFFAEESNVETLYRRPVFNTRDEPHANREEWIRVHVIAGDANMIPSCTRRKVGLVKLALLLEQAGETPNWKIRNAPGAFAELSRAFDTEGRIELDGGSWTTPRIIVESYLDAAERLLDTDDDCFPIIEECRSLLETRFRDPDQFAFSVDWAAKHKIMQMSVDSGVPWGSKELQSYDLAYHDTDRSESLYEGMVEMGLAEAAPEESDLQLRLQHPCEATRAFPRSIAVQRFRDKIHTLSWGSIVFRIDGELREVQLDPDLLYSEELDGVEDITEFIRRLNER